MKRIIVGFILFILLTTVLASAPVSALNMDNTSESPNPIEHRLQNIKKTIADFDLNSILQDNDSEPKCIILSLLLFLLYLGGNTGFFLTLAFDFLMLFIIFILMYL